MVLDAVDSNTHLYLCPPLGNKNTISFPFGMGFIWVWSFLLIPIHDSSNQTRCFAIAAHTAGNIFKMPCVSFFRSSSSAISSLELSSSSKAQSRSSDLWRCCIVPTSLQQVFSSSLQNGYLWISFSFLRAKGHLTHVWFLRQAIMPFCCMNEIPLRYVGLGQSHSGASIAGLEGMGVVSQWCSLTAYKFINMVFLFNF